MSDKTRIERTDATWNCVTGFDVQLRPDKLDLPLHWKWPRRVVVNSMSDLFHDQVPDEYIARVFAVMAAAPRHTFQLLTKRHARMRSLLNSPNWRGSVAGRVRAANPGQPLAEFDALTYDFIGSGALPNVWLGVSVEDQKWADIRIPALLETPAAVRWISAEPLLGPVDLDRYLYLVGASTAGPFYDYAGRRRPGRGGGIGGMTISAVPSRDLSWVVVGGESGRGARPMHLDWARCLRDECVEAEVPFFFKQWGTWCPPSQLPDNTFMNWDVENGTSSYDRDQPWRFSKKASGRLLDGRTHDEYPRHRAAAVTL